VRDGNADQINAIDIEESTAENQHQKRKIMKNKSESAIVPKQFLFAPIFASRPQKSPREIIVNGERWIVGSEHRLTVYSEKAKALNKLFPALDIRHGKLIFLLMSKYRMVLYDWKASINFSMYELCRDYFGVVDGRNFRRLADLLLDLEFTPIEIFDEKNESDPFPIINKPSYRKKYSRRHNQEQPEFWLESVSFHEKFVKYIIDFANWLSIRLDELFRMSTPLAAACYTYLPSRAWHHDGEKPFEITLSNLLEQLGEKVPGKKAERKRKFYRKDDRYDIDVVSDLDGAEINCERVLRCEMVETADGKDYKLRLWSETVKRPPSVAKGELWDAWRAGGGTAEEWSRLMSNYSRIEWDPYELDAFAAIPDWRSSERFYKMSKCLLGSRFTEELGIVKNAVREGAVVNGQLVMNPSAYLNYLLIRAVTGEKKEAS
jgi:hypothetical protein